MSDLRIGIVGLGWVAGAHLETFKHVTGARVTAVCSRREQDPAELKAKYGIPLKAYTDYAAMLADPEIDVVDICTPHPMHAKQAIAAARAGKHLVIEKPICLTWADAKAIKAAIDKAKVRAMVCFEVRYSAQFQLAKSIQDEGLLGELHYAEVDYYHGIGPWYGQFGWNIKKAMGGSSLLTAGCHALDALLMFMDAPVEEVTSYSTKSKSKIFKPYEYDTTSTTIIKFKGGKLGKCASVTDCLQPYYFHTHLVGSEGSLLDNKIYSHKLKGMFKGQWSTLSTHLVDSGDVKDHPYQPQFQAFVDATKAGKKMPLTDFDTAFESHRVVFAADLSAKKGRPVKLSELK
ncbi:MAG TPA: Gfo/Idh/MocA family oxidoreductase [Planctomycetota bacterium]|nr:Gfo/Idh/MocA family oxidoreductase [Planctomycetota bacterium]